MVKVFDMERTDVTVQLLNYLEAWRNRGSLLKHERIMRVLQECIKQQKDYIHNVGGLNAMPKVILKSNCSDSMKYKDSWKNLTHFPAYFESHNNSIVLCTGMIRHESKLKENFLRELYVATFPGAPGLSPDENLARSCYKGCLESMKVYTDDSKLLESMARICTKYEFKVIFGDLASACESMEHEKRRLSKPSS